MTVDPSASPSKDAATESRPLLRVEDLAVSFGDGPAAVRAVNGVSLTIHPRQTLAVVGESGCGKSVTALSLLQLIPRPQGRIDRGRAWFRPHGPSWLGQEIDLLRLDARQIRRIRGAEIAMIFQEPMTSLNPVFTIGDQIAEAVMLHQKVGLREALDIAEDALKEVGIRDPRGRLGAYPHQFSGGMRQRVMIAMALACRPSLLLADEPTTALDVTIQAQILELLSELRRTRGMSIMLITHSLGIVAGHADVVCVMYAGRVVEYAGVFDLFARPMHPYTRGLFASIPRPRQPRARLRTMHEVISDPEEFRRLPRSAEGIRPWWPAHEPPGDLHPSGDPAGDASLLEVAPNHWVCVWRTEAVAASSPRAPDLPCRVTDDPRRPTGGQSIDSSIG